MKVNKFVYLIGSLLLLSSCGYDKEPIPTEELFLRNFIKKFGLIDESQDWNLSERSSVTVNLPKDANKIVVYAEVFDDYYRVARCYNVEAGVAVLPVDVPVNTTSIAVEVDGVAYVTELGGKLDLTAEQPASRAAQSPIFLDESNILGWVIVAEDLGSDDDVDFNDLVMRMEYDETAYYALGYVAPDEWDVIDMGGDLYFDGTQIGSRSSRASGTNKVVVKALAAGGILKSWLHYRSSDNTDYIVSSNATGGKILTSSVSAGDAGTYEWHRWFAGGAAGTMINTAEGDYSGGNNKDDENTQYGTNEDVFIPTALYGARIVLDVDADFTFTTYSQMTYADGDPITSGNFSFDKHTINGFYITVKEYDETRIDNSEVVFAYDMGHVIGHNRNQGLPPQMFLIPDLCYMSNDGNAVGSKQGHFRWTTERTQIDNAYKEFDNWVKYGTAKWYQYGREDKVVSNEFLKSIYGSDY